MVNLLTRGLGWGSCSGFEMWCQNSSVAMSSWKWSRIFAVPGCNDLYCRNYQIAMDMSLRTVFSLSRIRSDTESGFGVACWPDSLLNTLFGPLLPLAISLLSSFKGSHVNFFLLIQTALSSMPLVFRFNIFMESFYTCSRLASCHVQCVVLGFHLRNTIGGVLEMNLGLHAGQIHFFNTLFLPLLPLAMSLWSSSKALNWISY